MRMKYLSFCVLAVVVYFGSGCTLQEIEANTNLLASTRDTIIENANVVANINVASNTETENEALLCRRATVSPRIPAGDVLALTKKDSATSYRFTEGHGAEIIPVNDNTSYVVWWQPDGFDPSTDTVLVSLGGHGGFAVKDFEVWYPQVSEREYAYLGVQWWFGRSLENFGYYDDQQIYKIIKEQLQVQGIPPGHVIFQGFSMGSARSYAVAMYDHECGEQWFGVNIANAGVWEDDYPLYTDVVKGVYGDTLLEDTHWILFCAGQDEEHPDACSKKQHTEERIQQFGGIIDLSFEDPDGEHGSFMKDSENSDRALDIAEEILAKNTLD